MSERIAQFEKVSFEQFCKDWSKNFPNDSTADIQRIYDEIKLPARATKGSAGYDFYAPVSFEMKPGEIRLIPTGIRAKIDAGYVLIMVPRSGLGFKYRMQLNNTIGVIDSDYYGTSNEGHIMCKFTNDSREDKTLQLNAGDGMVQGIFLPFGVTADDHADQERTGGFGSTDSK
jgi:dUTP pyrophosphatase